MMGCVYLITCIPTQQQYIGVTIHKGKHRFSQHLYDARNLRNLGSKLTTCLRKYDREDFQVDELFHSEDLDELVAREILEIQQRNTIKNGLNKAPGGEGYRKYGDKRVNGWAAARVQPTV